MTPQMKLAQHVIRTDRVLRRIGSHDYSQSSDRHVRDDIGYAKTVHCEVSCSSSPAVRYLFHSYDYHARSLACSPARAPKRLPTIRPSI